MAIFGVLTIQHAKNVRKYTDILENGLHKLVEVSMNNFKCILL